MKTELDLEIESATEYLISVYCDDRPPVIIWRDMRREKPWDDIAEHIVGDPTGDDQKIVQYYLVAQQLERKLKAKVLGIY